MCIYIYIGKMRLKGLRWLSVQIRTRTLLWFGHGCSVNRMQLEHGRYYGLGMDAVGNACNWSTDIIVVWAWMPLAWLRKHVVGLGSLKQPALKCTISIYIYI